MAGFKRRFAFISHDKGHNSAVVHDAFSRCPQIAIRVATARSVAGLGVEGAFGPRAGTSSGILPGSSSGVGGSPGSRIGGGISGCGFPGGCSRGGSVGVPGVGGGISGGSIGVGFASPLVSAITTRMPRCSRQNVSRAAGRYCSASCRPRDNRAKPCRRCSPAAIRPARDVRSRPRAAIALAALP